MKKRPAPKKAAKTTGAKPARASGKWSRPPEALVGLFGRVVDARPELERRMMFGCPVVFVNGNMCFSVHQSNLVARLPERRREALIAAGQATPFSPMPGMIMKEYVSLGDALAADEPAVRGLFGEAVAFTASLPPKKKQARAGKPSRRA
jgi:hypothetical protein